MNKIKCKKCNEYYNKDKRVNFCPHRYFYDYEKEIIKI